MKKIKIGDSVVVISGKDKGKVGKIKIISDAKGQLVVEGVNMVKKSVKPTQQEPSGGFVQKESFIDRSNVMLVSPKTNLPTRVGIVVRDGKKVRVAKKCGSVL